MKRFWIINLIVLVMFSGAIISCTDLDLAPIDDDAFTSDQFLGTPEAYEQLLAKLYSGLVHTGNQGDAGQGDVAGIDEGFSSYLRIYYYLQEMTTDELVVGWNDDGLRDLHNQNWTANNPFVEGMYARLFYNIVLSNEFIRLGSGSSDDKIKGYVNEVRFLRALAYWHALDMFRNVPFVTEKDPIGAFLPKQIAAADLFGYIEAELLEIEPLMADTGNPLYYARADKGAVRMLLAKLYLNAEAHIGVDRYDEAVTYTQKLINDPSYSLEANYDNLFRTDNDQSDEIIFHVMHDATIARHYGGMNMLVFAGIGGSMSASAYGVGGGWGGTRTTEQFVSKFTDETIGGGWTEGDAVDTRANFHADGQNLAIADLGVFTEGYAISKFKNVSSTGAAGSSGSFVDTDFPLFRLADAYLMYAEATLRGGSGNSTTALDLINDLRERAYGDASGNIGLGEMTLDFILDERARELGQECHRRTDLVRYGQFTNGAYLWAWKGGVEDGVAVSPNYNIFPIPSSDLTANPNLEQNTGY